MSVVQLQSETVRLLSCSQVITSTHSAVKELVENALDAKATTITIRLENHGLDVIEVRDNGLGVKRDDVPFLASPHSTSKIASFSDLCTLETYGFRGEALHSLATVGSLSVTTRTEGEDIAHVHQFSSRGEVVSSKPVAGERGTRVTVTQLFKQLPVRRQCYKNSRHCKEELRKIEDTLRALGIGHPEVYLQLRHNKHTLWQKPVASDFETNLQNILGQASIQQMTPLNYQCFNPMVKLQAFVLRPHADVSGLTRSTPDRVFLLVNRRPVMIKSLVQVVKHAFLEAFPHLKPCFPVAVVSISVLPQAIDVNLEPNKTSVLLHDLDFIASTLQSLLQQVYAPCRVPIEKDSAEHEVSNGGVGAPEFAGDPEEEEEDKEEEGEGEEPKKEEEQEGVGGCSVGVDGLIAPAPSEELDLSDLTVDMLKEDLLEVSRAEVSTLPSLQPSTSKPTSSALCTHQTSLSQWSRGKSTSKQQVEPMQVAIPRAPALSRESTPPLSQESAPPLSRESAPPLSRESAGHVSAPPRKLLSLSLSCKSAPPTRLSGQHSKSKLFPKRSSPSFDMIHSQPVKRVSTAMASPQSSKRQKQLPSREGTRGSIPRTSLEVSTQACTADREIQFDLAAVSKRYPVLSNEDTPQHRPANRVIGWSPLQEQGVWLVVHDSSIACLDVRRARESLAQSNHADTTCSLADTGETRESVETLLNTLTTATDTQQFFNHFHKL